MTSSIDQVYLLPIKLQNIYLLGRSISLLPLMMSSLFKLFFIFQNWEKLSLSLSLSRPKKGSNFNQLRFFIKTFLKRLSPNQNSNSILCKLIFPLCGCVTSLMTTTVGINPSSLPWRKFLILRRVLPDTSSMGESGQLELPFF